MRRAFTLLDILVTISVVALLIALVSPALSKSMEAARLTKCSSNLRQLYIAASLYVDTYGTTPIWNEYPEDEERRRVFEGVPDATFRCPSDPDKGINRRGGQTSYDLSGIARLRADSLKRTDPNNSGQSLLPRTLIFRDYSPSHFGKMNSIRLSREVRPYPDPAPPPRSPR